jgi:hypothetical protein
VTYLILAVLGITLVIVLWLSAQLIRVRAKLAVIPEDNDVLAFLRRLDNDLARVDHSVTALAPRLTEIETMLPSGISFTGVVAYDAFGDIAGNQSRSIALLDRRGNGLVISLLVGRGETRFYTKQVTARLGDEPLSPEEEAAIDRALAG